MSTKFFPGKIITENVSYNIVDIFMLHIFLFLWQAKATQKKKKFCKKLYAIVERSN
jgi:hypothetical protein